MTDYGCTPTVTDLRLGSATFVPAPPTEPRMSIQWSHMTHGEAVALQRLLADLETPRRRQFWRRAQLHAHDHTCVVTEPTDLEIQAIAHLRKERAC